MSYYTKTIVHFVVVTVAVGVTSVAYVADLTAEWSVAVGAAVRNDSDAVRVDLA